MNRRNYLARPQLRDERPRRPVRSAVLVGTLALGLGVGAACGSDVPTKAAPSAEAVGNDGTISGMQRDEPLDVSAIRLPEAVDGATAGEFTTVAKPGGLLVMYFGYTNCPDVCPTTLAALRQAYKGLGDDAKRIETAMVTVDPARDTAEVLPGYLASFISARTHALIPADDAQLKTAEAAYLATSSITTGSDGQPEVAHSGTTYVVDEHGKVLVEWPFGTTPAAMRNDLSILIDQLGPAGGAGGSAGGNATGGS